MISITTVVIYFFFLLGIGVIFALLMYLVRYIEKEFPMYVTYFKAARIFLVIAGVLVLIGLILDAMGHPLIEWRSTRR